MLLKSITLIFILLLTGSFMPKIEIKPVKMRCTASLHLIKNITDAGLSSKSVVHSGNGLFFAQNMMYSHNISVYNRDFERVKIISDAVKLSKFGFQGYEGTHQGAPVECAFSHNGLYAWVSNYQMYGTGFNNAGQDNCKMNNGYDQSFVYKINTETFEIEKVIQAGAVPKYVAVSPDSRYVLVSNWCSGDVNIIDTQSGQTVKSIPMGSHPRGIVVDNNSEKAYVAVMGSSKIGVINLNDFSVSWLRDVGSGPRHLCISPDNAYLFVTLNSEGKVAKIDLSSGEIISKVSTGNAPRSMAMMGNYLYVVNYFSNTLSKVRASDMEVIETVPTKAKPIGITTDAEAQTVWVSCYSGNIMVFQDSEENVSLTVKSYKPVEVLNPVVVTSTTPATQEIVYSENEIKIPQKTIKKTVAKTVHSKSYYIIIESCTNRNKAEQVLELWKAKGVTKARILTTGNQFRIAANFYKTKTEADKAIAQIKLKHKPDAWIWEH